MPAAGKTCKPNWMRGREELVLMDSMGLLLAQSVKLLAMDLMTDREEARKCPIAAVCTDTRRDNKSVFFIGSMTHSNRRQVYITPVSRRGYKHLWRECKAVYLNGPQAVAEKTVTIDELSGATREIVAFIKEGET